LSLTLPAPCDGAPAPGKCAAAKHPRLILATCILASSLAFIDGSVLNVALPAIARSYGATTAEMQWVINAFTLPLTALLLLGGAAGDLYGRRRLMLFGIALFTIASVLCAAAPSLALFLAARALQGLGAAMLMPNSLAILSASFAGQARGRAVGTWAAAGAVSGAFAPMLGGWLVDTASWPFIFLLNVPIALAAVALGHRFVPESENEDRPPPDWAGAMLATFGLGALTWGLTIWSAGDRLDAAAAALAAGILLILAFLAVERRRGSHAMVPLALFGSRPFVGLTLFTFLLYGALGGLMLLLPFTLIEARGYSAVAAGAALLPLPIVIALGSPLMGKLAARFGPRWPLTLGPLLVAGGFALALRIVVGDAGYWTGVLPSILMVSAGMAIAVAPLTTAVLGSVDEGHVGTASGLNSAVARGGGLIATALLGIVLSRQGPALAAAFHGAAIVGAALALISSLTAFALLRSPAGRTRSSR